MKEEDCSMFLHILQHPKNPPKLTPLSLSLFFFLNFNFRMSNLGDLKMILENRRYMN